MKLVNTHSKNSEQFYIQKTYVKPNKKTASKTIRKLGSLATLMKELNTDRDGVVAWCKEQVRLETLKDKEENDIVSVNFSPTLQIKKDDQKLFNCGYLFLQSIYSELRFDNTLRNIKARHSYEYNLDSILSDLIYSRILSPSSKLSSYDFSKSFLEPPTYELHDVYRALSVLAEESDYIQSEVYKNSNFIHARNNKVLYYDCTNYYFEIEQEDEVRKFGKSKENRPNPIIGMGLFMDADGYPLAFGLHPGNQNEQLTLKPLEQKIIRDFDCAEFIYCSDSGLGSTANKQFNTAGGRSYVITQSLKKLKQADRDTALNPTQFRKLGSKKFIDIRTLDEDNPEVFDSIYYKEIPLDSKKLNETMIVTYSPKYRAYQSKIREGQINRAKKLIDDKGKIKAGTRNPNDPSRFIKKTSTTKDGEVADETYCVLDEDVINAEKQYDGFYAVVTDIEGDVSEIIAINQRRWQIEECFRIMKTEFKARPVYLQRKDRIEAHFLICFLSLLIYRILETKLDNKYTAEKIIETLKGMNLTLLESIGYIPSYTRTDLTDKLHTIFNFHTDRQITKKAKMKSIIKYTKHKN